MKTIFKFFAFIFILGVCNSKLYAQTEQGQAYFIRSLNYVGSAVPFKLYIDDVLVCKLKNNKFSIHNLTPGQHSFSVQNTGLSNHKKSEAIKINIEANKTSYLTIVNGANLYLQEVTPASADQLFKKTVQQKNCL